jgi:hypothetical protein
MVKAPYESGLQCDNIRSHNNHKDVNKSSSRDKDGREAIVFTDPIVTGVGLGIGDEWNGIHIALTCECARTDRSGQVGRIKLGLNHSSINKTKLSCSRHSASKNGLKVIYTGLIVV